MHEGPVAQSILQIVQDYAAENQAKQVKKVTVIVGEMTGYVESAIRFYWESLTLGTVAEGSEIEIYYVPIKVKCNNCGIEYEAKDQFDLFCPNCNFFGGTVITGKELLVDSIEIEK